MTDTNDRPGFSATCPRGHTMASSFSAEEQRALADQAEPVRLWCNYCGEHWEPSEVLQHSIRRWARGEVT